MGKININKNDVVFLFMGGNDIMMNINMEPLDFINTVRNFIKSMFDSGISNVIVANLANFKVLPY